MEWRLPRLRLWLEVLSQEVRYAVRALWRTPGFTSVVVITLALGIGACTAIFSVVQAVLVRSLPYKDADRFVRVLVRPPGPLGTGTDLVPAGVDRTQVEALRSPISPLTHLGVYVPATMTLTRRDEAVRINGQRLSPDVLAMLGETPLLGRLFERREDSPGLDRIVILSFTAWQRYFNGRGDILGQVVTLDGNGYAVVGVMRSGFQFPDADTHFWIPFAWPDRARLVVTGRMRDGVTLAAATDAVDTMLARYLPQPPTPRPRATFHLVRLQDQVVSPVRPALLMLSAAVGLVLLIACVNVANLVLARGAGRRAEMAMRMALGASRGRLIAQTLTESLLLSLAAGAIGTGLAFGGLRAIQTVGAALPRRGIAPSFSVPRLDQAGLDGTVLLFTLLLSIATGVMFGLAPALRQAQATRIDPARDSMASPAAGFNLLGRRRGRGALVVIEIALAMLLFLGAGLLLRSFVTLSHVDPGFDAAGVLTFQVALPPNQSSIAFRDELLARLAALPGVRAAGIADQLPMSPSRGAIQLRNTPELPPGPPPPPAAPGATRPPQFPDLRIISQDLPRAMGMSIVEGRAFADGDRAGQPQVMLINRTLARSGLFGSNPIGQRIYAVGTVPWEIVGIVEDARQIGLDREPGPQVFVDIRQMPSNATAALATPYFVVRTDADGSPAALTSTIRGIVRQIHPQATLDSVATMGQIVASSLARPRVFATLLGIFAMVAVLLAAVGIYGVMSYVVTQRTREIGIRMALGAARADVLRMVLGQSVVLIAMGVTAGVLGGIAVTGSLAGLLFGVTARDPATFVVVPIAFAAIATVAAFLPAHRAARVDPLIALRRE